VGVKSNPVVLGLGGTVDYELCWDTDMLQRLIDVHGIGPADIGPDRNAEPIETERDLVASVVTFLGDGQGGERYVESSAVLLSFAEHFGYATSLGGTGVRAGLVARVLGVGSTQHLVSIDDHVRRLLPSDIDVICSADHDTTDPHLIVQFPRGATVTLRGGDSDSDSDSDGSGRDAAVRTVTASRANRLIYVNDPPNRELLLSPDLPEVLADAHLFLVSGFNSMQEEDALVARVAQVREAMRRLPDDAVVLFEDAGYHQPAFGSIVLGSLGDRIDAYSLNEDELQLRIGRSVDLLDAEDVRAAVDQLAAITPAPVILLHTHAYALARAENPARWLPVLDSGVRVSGARYAGGDGITRQDIDGMDTRFARSPDGTRVVRALAAADARYAGVPTFVIDVPTPTTIGLGDSFVGGMVAALELARRGAPVTSA
jgi:ADP-dependent phosphofructokinase/glucokinase